MASPSLPDSVIDGGLNALAAATAVSLCSTDPNGVYGNIAGAELAKYTGLTTGSFTIANGDTSGRKITLNALSGNNGTASGAANFVVFHDNSSTWLGTFDGDGDTVNSGSAANINSSKLWESADPA